MITIAEARERVARGAAHLDRVRPGWEKKIDVGTLTLSSCKSCVLGQLFSDESEEFHFLRGTEVLGWDNVACMVNGVGADNNDDFALLQDAWIEAIAERRVSQEVLA